MERRTASGGKQPTPVWSSVQRVVATGAEQMPPAATGAVHTRAERLGQCTRVQQEEDAARLQHAHQGSLDSTAWRGGPAPTSKAKGGGAGWDDSGRRSPEEALLEERACCERLREQVQAAEAAEQRCAEAAKELRTAAEELEARRESLRTAARCAHVELLRRRDRASSLELEARRRQKAAAAPESGATSGLLATLRRPPATCENRERVFEFYLPMRIKGVPVLVMVADHLWRAENNLLRADSILASKPGLAWRTCADLESKVGNNRLLRWGETVQGTEEGDGWVKCRIQFAGRRSPVGLPNRCNDCFWLAALQCLRHTPGFQEAVSSSLEAPATSSSSGARAGADAGPAAAPSEGDRGAGCHRPGGGAAAPSAGKNDLARALAGLLRAMDDAEGIGKLEHEDAELAEFRRQAAAELPAWGGGRGGGLVQRDSRDQLQEDTHEFLSQLLDHLASRPQANERPPSPRSPGGQTRVEALEKELTQAAKDIRSARHGTQSKTIKTNHANLLYEYSMVQWGQSTTRMRSRAFGKVFEGQLLASVRCQSCQRYGPSGAEPFVIEEVKVHPPTVDSSWFSQLGSWLNNPPTPPEKVELEKLLQESAQSPAGEGYRCPNKACAQVGCSTRRVQFLRLPSTLILHVNRALPDGSRCEIPLEFGPVLDLERLDMVMHFGQPLDQSLEPCSTRYDLVGAVFHRGTTARAGHYFAYVLFSGQWLRLDDDLVEAPERADEADPSALEASAPAGGARVALLFYQRQALEKQ